MGPARHRRNPSSSAAACVYKRTRTGFARFFAINNNPHDFVRHGERRDSPPTGRCAANRGVGGGRGHGLRRRWWRAWFCGAAAGAVGVAAFLLALPAPCPGGLRAAPPRAAVRARHGKGQEEGQRRSQERRQRRCGAGAQRGGYHRRRASSSRRERQWLRRERAGHRRCCDAAATRTRAASVRRLRDSLRPLTGARARRGAARRLGGPKRFFPRPTSLRRLHPQSKLHSPFAWVLCRGRLALPRLPTFSEARNVRPCMRFHAHLRARLGADVENPSRSTKLWGEWRLLWTDSKPMIKNRGGAL